MSAVLALLTIVLPVFLVVGSGYVMVRLKAFPNAGIDMLIKFATGFAVPVLLFRAMYGLDLSSALRLDHQLSFYIAASICFAIGIFLARKIWKRRPGEAVAIGFCGLFSNSVLLGLPIMERAYGRLDEIYALITFHTPFCLSLGILTMEFCRRDAVPLTTALKQTAKAMVGNALMIGLVTGVVANLSGLQLPGPLLAAVDMIADAALPVALFSVGGVLTRYAFSDNLAESLMVASLSIVLHPALAWLLATQVFALPAPFVQAAVVMAAMPTGINAYIFAALYKRAEGTAASSVLVATLLSVVTIPIWLAVLGGAL
ncbi:MAG: AEC family transporter [Pseudomonadota bacterium]